MSIATTYLKSVLNRFIYYRELGDKTIEQLSDEQLFSKTDPEANSIAIIVNHMHGNMLSRWTDFLNSDGEKEWRMRDEEFEDRIKTRTQLTDKWNEGWDCLFHALKPLGESDLEREVFIRSEAHSVVEAINRQLAHYAYHVGQMVFIGRMLKKQDWQSLSIPKGGSEQFNASMFGADTMK